MHGLALDFIVGATVVLADGSIVEASASKNADLLWAIKGAGSSYGIVVSWRLRTFEAPTVLTRFGISMGWNKTNAVAGIEAVEKYAKLHAPREINFRIGDYNKGSPGLEGLYYGTEAQWRVAIAPLLADLPSGWNISGVSNLNWIQAVISYSNYDSIDFITPSPVSDAP
jgi:FAD/FMN-containing dehydrogenase